jgi:hypothetical protein
MAISHKLLSLIIFSLLIYLIVISLYYNVKEDFVVNDSNISFGASIENLELAYLLCGQENTDKCHRYVRTYEKLRNEFKSLRREYCRNYPDMCKKLNAL